MEEAQLKDDSQVGRAMEDMLRDMQSRVTEFSGHSMPSTSQQNLVPEDDYDIQLIDLDDSPSSSVVEEAPEQQLVIDEVYGDQEAADVSRSADAAKSNSEPVDGTFESPVTGVVVTAFDQDMAQDEVVFEGSRARDCDMPILIEEDRRAASEPIALPVGEFPPPPVLIEADGGPLDESEESDLMMEEVENPEKKNETPVVYELEPSVVNEVEPLVGENPPPESHANIELVDIEQESSTVEQKKDEPSPPISPSKAETEKSTRRKPGRPPRKTIVKPEESKDPSSQTEDEPQKRRGPGRPKRSSIPSADEVEAIQKTPKEVEPVAGGSSGKKRGRPFKRPILDDSDSETATQPELPKKRGRPSRKSIPAPSIVEPEPMVTSDSIVESQDNRSSAALTLETPAAIEQDTSSLIISKPDDQTEKPIENETLKSGSNSEVGELETDSVVESQETKYCSAQTPLAIEASGSATKIKKPGRPSKAMLAAQKAELGSESSPARPLRQRTSLVNSGSKPSPSKAIADVPKRGPGRPPRKSLVEAEESKTTPKPRGPGRWPKKSVIESEDPKSSASKADVEVPKQKGPGRWPKKSLSETEDPKPSTSKPAVKGPGRWPKKSLSEAEEPKPSTSKASDEPQKRRPGRPPKNSPAVLKPKPSTPKAGGDGRSSRRGRPSKASVESPEQKVANDEAQKARLQRFKELIEEARLEIVTKGHKQNLKAIEVVRDHELDAMAKAEFGAPSQAVGVSG